MKEEAALFKTLSDPTRLRLTVLLAIRGESCVCELAEALNEPEFKISRHLSILRAARIVDARREGTWMYYNLLEAQSSLGEWLHLFFRKNLNDHPVVQEDVARLDQAVKRRPENCQHQAKSQ